jgi:hypothetical protein
MLTLEDAIDHTKDHTRAMKILEDAGVHVLFVSSLASLVRKQHHA